MAKPRGNVPFSYKTNLQIYPYQLVDNYVHGARYFWEKFTGVQTLAYNNAAGVTAFPTASQGQTDLIVCENGGLIQLYQSTAQTLMPTAQAAGGLEIALDQVENEAVEYVPGCNLAAGKLTFTLGTSPNFFIKARFAITDVSGTDQCAIGFRKQEAFTATPVFAADGAYTDFACLNVVSGDLYTCTDLNNSGTATATDTGFNWADGETHTLEIRVVGRTPIYYVNGSKLPATISVDGNGTAMTAETAITPPTFTFDAAEVLIPFIHILQDGDVTPVILYELEVGELRMIGKDRDSE